MYIGSVSYMKLVSSIFSTGVVEDVVLDVVFSSSRKARSMFETRGEIFDPIDKMARPELGFNRELPARFGR